ncbi:MAG: hypothetical protein H6742_04025 [Alphaproteobacteria bacterium]|nr:hypothetical protein [Alphaproteobacteria bacterium]
MSEIQASPLSSAPDTDSAEGGRSTWDVSTLLLTGLSAMAIVGAIGTALELALPLTVALSVGIGGAVGLLAGYQPLHELDAPRRDADTDERWKRGA